MNLPNEDFCVLPWISLEASPIGTVRPCCLAEHELKDNTGEKFNLLTAEFTSIQNSNDMRRLREQFLAGEQPETCRKCWREERAGRTSKRMHTQVRLKELYPQVDFENDNPDQLWFIDLKLGNICNLKCRICGSWSSSQFATEEIQWTPREDQKTSYSYQMLRAGAWPRENESFWNQIDASLDNIRYIEFTGGEPFLIDQHFDMLQGIVDRGIAHQVEIHYNTNGTQFPEQAIEIWRHFKLVEIAISVDDLGSRFEYQRSNAVWTEVCENLDRFRDLKEQYPNIVLQVCTTVNVFNVRYLDQVAEWINCNRESFNFVYWNMMHDAYYFSISTLPETAKAAITERLLTADIPDKFKDDFKRTAEFMNKGNSLDGQLLRMNLRDLDSKRQQNLADVEPEFAKLIDYDFNRQ